MTGTAAFPFCRARLDRCALQSRAFCACVAALALTGMAACGGDSGDPETPITTAPASTASTAPPSATDPPTTAGPSPDPQPTAPSIDGASQADAICIDAAEARDEIPVTGSDSEDFASEEFAVSQIMFDAADRLAGLGASELAATMEAYARSRSDLAAAYDQELMSGVSDASAAVDAAADRLAVVASDAGAFDCVALAES